MTFQLPLIVLCFLCTACQSQVQQTIPTPGINHNTPVSFADKIVDAALSITHDAVSYNGSYFVIDYPNGDVPKNIGVCTDVVIRTFRKLGIDLQKEIHEDISAHWDDYPRLWDRKTPDKNIDHRRVPNLMTYFKKYGTVKPNSQNAADYSPGDIVAWRLPNGLTHIGIVVNIRGKNNRYQVVHNIGRGQEVEDCLFDFTVIGHYAVDRNFYLH